MTRLGTCSPSCSGFEAEPLCWLQHSEQVAARLAQPGKLILWRPACNRTGEEQPDEGGGRTEEEGLWGGDPPLGSPGPATPRTGLLCFFPTGIYMCPGCLCTRHSRAFRDPQGPQAGRSPTPKALTGHLPSPLPCCPYLLASTPLWIAPAGLPGTGDTRAPGVKGGTWASQVGSQLQE